MDAAYRDHLEAFLGRYRTALSADVTSNKIWLDSECLFL